MINCLRSFKTTLPWLLALQFILVAAETKKLPPYGVLPTFNESYLDDRVQAILEKVTGEKYS